MSHQLQTQKFTYFTNIWENPDQDPELNQPQIKVTPESRFTHRNAPNLQTLRYGREETDLCESETYEYQSSVQEVD